MSEQELQSFGAFPAATRVEAVLAGVHDPVSRELALDFAGVNFDELPEEEKTAVNGVFSSPYVQPSEHEQFGTRYQILSDQQEEVLQRLGIDRQVVARHLADLLWDDLFEK